MSIVEYKSNTVDSIKKELIDSQLECQRLNERLLLLLTHQKQKIELIGNLKEGLLQLEKLQKENSIKLGIGRLLRLIDLDESLEINWDIYSKVFDNANQDFLKRISQKHLQLTPKDLKLCAYLRLKLSTKEIAPLLNISVRGVEISRYRLRKKMDLNSNENLIEYLGGF